MGCQTGTLLAPSWHPQINQAEISVKSFNL